MEAFFVHDTLYSIGAGGGIERVGESKLLLCIRIYLDYKLPGFGVI